MTHACPHTAHGDPHHQPQVNADGQAEILDLDAEVLAEHIASITEWLPVETSPRHIVDLGCGTGAGTFALLTRYPEAHVTAVDSSPAMLAAAPRANARNSLRRSSSVERLYGCAIPVASPATRFIMPERRASMPRLPNRLESPSA